GDKKFFTENFLYYIDSFGWVKIMKEGKKAPGQYFKFTLKVCIYAIFNVNYQGRVGIGCESFSYNPVSNNRVKMKQLVYD
ncbi:MAG TPA: hypothetical protein PL076_08975, partial [Bacillota bacterium]|nr:hypothetical protein [Bacillota bacterium]